MYSGDDVPGLVHAAAGSAAVVYNRHVCVRLFSRTHRDHTCYPHVRTEVLPVEET